MRITLSRRAPRALLAPRDQQELDRLSKGFDRTAAIDYDTHLSPDHPRVREFLDDTGNVAIELTTEPHTPFRAALREAHAALDRAQEWEAQHRSRQRGGETTAANIREKRKHSPDVKRICRLAKRYETSDDLQRLHRTAVAYIRKETGFSRGKVLRALSPTK